MVMKVLEKIIEHVLYLFVFLLPWQTRLILREGNLNGYWEYGTISIYATEVLLWAIFAMAAVWGVINKLKIKKEKLKITIKNSKLLFFCLLSFVFYAFISFFWADSKSVALQAWVRLAEGIGLFLILRIARIDWMKVAWAFVISAVIQAGLGVWQFFTQSTFASKWLGMAFHDPIEPGTFVVETTLRRWLRAYGSLPHPNMLAGFLAVAMFLVIWLYQRIDYGLKKLLLPIFFSILTLGFLVTFSKSAIVALGVAVLFLWGVAWFTHQSKETKFNLLKFTLIFLVITAVFGAVFWEPVSTRIYGQDRLEIKSTEQRLSYFGEAWQLIKKHPMFGVGIGNYTLAVHNEINANLQSWDYQPVHNVYLLVLVELGVIGFMFVFLFLCFFVSLFLKLLKEKNFSHLTIFSVFFFITIIGLFDHYLWTLYFGIIIFYLGIGLTRPLDKCS